MNLLENEYGGHWGTPEAASYGAADTAHRADTGATLRAFSFRETCYVPIKDAGIRAGEIVAYRAWTLDRDGLLRSMYAQHIWMPESVEKADSLKYHGLHAFKTLRQARSCYKCYGIDHSVVFGEVLLWGDVIEHERGYRAEFARINRILEIYDFGPHWGWLKFWKPRRITTLRKRYRVTPRPLMDDDTERNNMIDLTIVCAKCGREKTLSDVQPVNGKIDAETAVKKANRISQQNGEHFDIYCTERCAA